jgi:hypothetical protein
MRRSPRPARLLGRRSLLAAAVSLALAACSRDSVGPGDVVPPPPVTPPASATTLDVVGLGRVVTRYTGEVTVRGTHAYTSTWGRRTASGNVILIWSVAGDTPVLLDSLVIEGVTTTGDVQVSDDGALLVVATEPTGYLVTYSLADPVRPRLLSRFTSPNLAAGVHTAQVSRVNGRQYAFCSIDPRGPVRAKLVVVDLADPAAPVEVLSREMGFPFVHDVFVRDGYLFTALWNAGLTIWDVGGGGRGGSPSNPVSIGTVVTKNGSVHNVWWYHDGATGQKRYAFIGEEVASGVTIGQSSAGDVHVVDLTDMASPREVAFYSVPQAGTHNFSVDEQRGVLYAAYYNGGVRAIDVRGDLGACTGAQRAVDGRCDLRLMGRELARALDDRTAVSALSGQPGAYVWGVELAGAFVYASDMLGGLWKLRAMQR